MGHEVTVLTAKPNYPLGEFLPGWERGLWRTEVKNGIKVIHCWLYPSRSKRTLLRLLNYFSFVLSSAFIGTFSLRRADILMVESPPLFLGLTAWWLSRIKRARLIFNISDLYPETAIELGYLDKRWLQKLMYRFEAWCYNASSLVTGQTEGIIDSIQSRFPDKLTFLLTNGVDIEQFEAVAQQSQHNKADVDESFIVGYAGVLGHFQGLDVVLEAARLCRRIPACILFFTVTGHCGRI